MFCKTKLYFDKRFLFHISQSVNHSVIHSVIFLNCIFFMSFFWHLKKYFWTLYLSWSYQFWIVFLKNFCIFRKKSLVVRGSWLTLPPPSWHWQTSPACHFLVRYFQGFFWEVLLEWCFSAETRNKPSRGRLNFLVS